MKQKPCSLLQLQVSASHNYYTEPTFVRVRIEALLSQKQALYQGFVIISALYII